MFGVEQTSSQSEGLVIATAPIILFIITVKLYKRNQMIFFYFLVHLSAFGFRLEKEKKSWSRFIPFNSGQPIYCMGLNQCPSPDGKIYFCLKTKYIKFIYLNEEKEKKKSIWRNPV